MHLLHNAGSLGGDTSPSCCLLWNVSAGKFVYAAVSRLIVDIMLHAFSNLQRFFYSVRKEADAKRLQAEFGDFFTPLLFDVTDEEAVHRAAAEVKSRMKGHYLMGLVNNAGDTLLKPFGHASLFAFFTKMSNQACCV